MKFRSIVNIWTVDVSLLSNSDLARVYFERAKQVVAWALTDSAERQIAVVRSRLLRAYVAKKIGAQYAVTTQNPKIRQLLAQADALIIAESTTPQSPRSHEIGAPPQIVPPRRGQ